MNPSFVSKERVCRESALNSIRRAIWFPQLNCCSSFYPRSTNHQHRRRRRHHFLQRRARVTNRLAGASSVNGWTCPVGMLVRAEGCGQTSPEWETTLETNECNQLEAEPKPEPEPEQKPERASESESNFPAQIRGALPWERGEKETGWAG